MERKGLTLELKADEPGALRAVFSSLSVVDKDFDVTLPGAFENGAPVRLLPAHDWAHYPIGRGRIVTDTKQAVFDGHFNLNTTAGRDWYEAVKDASDLQEFSYGFDVLDWSAGEQDGRRVRFLRKLQVHEVSPVTLGAGVNTRVLTIKGAAEGELAFREIYDYFAANPDEAAAFLADIGAPVEDLKPFANEHACRLASPERFDRFRRASRDSDGKRYDIIFGHPKDGGGWEQQAFRYPKSSWTAAQARSHCSGHDGIGFEPAGESSSVDGDDDEKQLAANESGQTFAEEAERVLADVQALQLRAAAVASLRAKEGRTFSAANISRLGTIADAVAASADDLRGLLGTTEPGPKERDALSDVQQLYADFQRLETLYVPRASPMRRQR